MDYYFKKEEILDGYNRKSNQKFLFCFRIGWMVVVVAGAADDPDLMISLGFFSLFLV